MIIIDRFEDKRAVLEIDGEIVDVDRSLMPADADEGDVLCITDSGYAIDRAATDARRAAMRERFKRLRGRSNG